MTQQMASYSHLSIQHRQLLGKLKKQGKSLRHIARILGVAPSTVSREIKRNYTGFGYCCNLAQHKTRSRRARANQIHRKLDDEAQNFIEAKLRCKHSPEQIASQFPNRLSRNISPQSIYRFIKSYDGSRRNLRPLLRRKGKRQISKTQRHAVVRNKPSIEAAPWKSTTVPNLATGKPISWKAQKAPNSPFSSSSKESLDSPSSGSSPIKHPKRGYPQR